MAEGLGAPTAITFCYTRGDTKRIALDVKDDQGNAIDITGWTFLMSWNSEATPEDDTNQVLQMVGTIDDAVAGQFSFAPLAGDWATIPVANYTYDVQTDTGTEIITLARGTVIVQQDITKN